MDFIKTTYLAFRQKYGSTMDDIETAVFVFIEELIMSKNISLDTQINYSQMQYGKDLRTIVDTISQGLKSLTIPEQTILSRFSHHYITFQVKPELKTYVDWIAHSFQPRIQIILFMEILQYLIGQDSAIKGIVNLGLLNQAHLNKFNDIRHKETKLLQYVEWYFLAITTLNRKIMTPELDYMQMIEFKEPERDIQSLYMGYRLLELLNIEDQIADMTKVAEFFSTKTDKWGPQNPNISEKYPMTLFSGVYICAQRFLPFEKEQIKEILKKILVNLVNSFKCPIFEDTFLTSYVLRACDLMELKLTQKLIAGITRFDESIVTEEKLKTFSTSRLAKVYQIYSNLNILDQLPERIRVITRNIINSRKRDNLFFNYDIDFFASCEAIYGAFLIYNFENMLDQFPSVENIDFALTNIKENLIMLDFSLTGQLSDIYYGLKFIALLNELPENQALPIICKYLFGITPTIQPIHSSIESEIKSNESDAKGKILGVGETVDLESTTPSPITSDPRLNTPILKPEIPEISKKDAAISSITPLSRDQRPLPKHFWDFFGAFPIINPDIADELAINKIPILKPHESIFSSLMLIHRWVVCLKVLNLEFPITKEEILKRTAPFRKQFGFGIEGSEMPDPQNTFYGLSIYSEFGLMDVLDLQRIKLYLIAEINNFNESYILTNDYIFMSFRLLVRHGVQMPEYSYLINRILNIKIDSQNEQINSLTDMIHFINAIRAIDPNYDLSFLNEDFIQEVQIAIEEDGSIYKKASTTALVMCSLYELGLQGIAEAKFMIKFLQYETKIFSDIVAKEPIGFANDPLGYQIELGMCYWTLLTLTLIYPMIPSIDKMMMCPECNKFFQKRPKFCNGCGHKFI